MDMGVFASVNGPSYGSDPGVNNAVSVMYVVDHLLNVKPWLNATTACSFPEPWKKENDTKSDVELTQTSVAVNKITDYVGSYGNHLFADVEVYVNSSTLLLNSNHVHGILHPYSEEDVFFYEITYPWEFTAHDNKTQPQNITFIRNKETGAITSLVVTLEVDVTYVKGESLFDIETHSPPTSTLGGMKEVLCNGHDLMNVSSVILFLSLILSFNVNNS